MPFARCEFFVQDDRGNIVPGAEITVQVETSGAPLATLYSDRDGAVPLANPFTIGSDGLVAFHAAGNAYRITAVSGAFSATWRYVAVGTAAEYDGPIPSLTTNDQGWIGIGSNRPPECILDVDDNATAGAPPAFTDSIRRVAPDGDAAHVELETYGNDASIIMRIANGTRALPTAINSGRVLGGFTARGWNGVDFTGSSRVKIQFNATQDWTETANGTEIEFYTTQNDSVSNTKKMKLTHDGILHLGAGSEPTLSSLAAIRARLWNAGACEFNLRNTTNNTEMGVRAGGSSVLFGSTTNHPTYLMSNGTSRAGVDTSGHFAPTADNTYSNGTSSLKWSVIYSSTGTINTSDQRAKTPIRTFTDAELRAARVIAAGVGVFQWLAAVEAKGNAARLHAGVAAQAVAAAMKAEGLDPGRYAWWCADHVTSVDDSGVEVESIVYGVRYDQLAMWLIAAQEARLRALEDHAA